MIRNLEPDELVWFMGRALAFVGHADPHGLAVRLNARLKDPVADAARCYVNSRPGSEPSAGLFVEVRAKGAGARTATITSVWHAGDPAALVALIEHVIGREAPEAVTVPLHLLGSATARALEELLAPLGFERDEVRRMRFELTEVPPLGRPLVLEAWQPDSEAGFRELFEACEGGRVGDARWSYMKRQAGAFQPDLWFVARDGLDQDPVGYAFTGATSQELDASYELTAVGVLRSHRGDSEMLRRLVVSTLRELAGRSPVGNVHTTQGSADPKLGVILASLGFTALEKTPLLVRLPR
ncbi:MAG: hypothetical protein IT345_01910 [Trueperaceae bacterium]|nr:hypothetical protein [Trueperaceae bacterium]